MSNTVCVCACVHVYVGIKFRETKFTLRRNFILKYNYFIIATCRKYACIYIYFFFL